MAVEADVFYLGWISPGVREDDVVIAGLVEVDVLEGTADELFGGSGVKSDEPDLVGLERVVG